MAVWQTFLGWYHAGGGSPLSRHIMGIVAGEPLAIPPTGDDGQDDVIEPARSTLSEARTVTGLDNVSITDIHDSAFTCFM